MHAALTKTHAGLLLLLVCTSGTFGLVNCCHTVHGLGKLSNCKNMWAALPHYHHKAQHEGIDIGASHQQSVQIALYTPLYALTASMIVTTQNIEQLYVTPHTDTTTHHLCKPMSQVHKQVAPSLHVSSDCTNQDTYMFWLDTNNTRCQISSPPPPSPRPHNFSFQITVAHTP